jgi:hypothetical protein
MALLAWWGRRTAPAVVAAALALAAASAASMWALYDPAAVSRAYYGTDARAGAILLGAALAAWLAWRGPVSSRGGRRLVEIAGTAGIAVLGVAWSRLEGEAEALYRGGFLTCGLATIAVIAAAVHPERRTISRVLSWRPLCLLGIVSYGVYLWHWPLYVVLDEARMGLAGWRLLGVRIAATLVVAAGSYVLVERPVRRGALGARQWRTRARVRAVPSGVQPILAPSTTCRSCAAPAFASPGNSVTARLSPRSRTRTGAPASPDRIVTGGQASACPSATSWEKAGPGRAPRVVTTIAATIAMAAPGATVHRTLARPAARPRAPPMIPPPTPWRRAGSGARGVAPASGGRPRVR